jgi:hypothetical protein
MKPDGILALKCGGRSVRVGFELHQRGRQTMKSKTIIVVLAFTGIFVLSGCKPNETKITGQVFIATGGGVSVRLGAVEVQVIEKQQAIDFILRRQNEIPAAKQALEKAQRDYDTYVEAISKELNPLEEQLEELRTENTRLRDAAQAEHARLVRAKLASGASTSSQAPLPATPLRTKRADSAAEMAAKVQKAKDAAAMSALQRQASDTGVQCGILWTKAVELFYAPGEALSYPALYKDKAYPVGENPSVKQWRVFIDATSKAWPNLRAEVQTRRETRDRTKREKGSNLAAAKSHLARLTTPDLLIVDFSPVTIAKANTDADGNFSIAFPRNREFAVFARAERATLAEAEKYCWLVDAPAAPSGGRVLLNNNNLVQVDPDGYFTSQVRTE